VTAQLPDAILGMCGPPSDKRTQLFATVSNVRYLGHRSPDFMARLIRTADVVAVPSTYEGFGLPTLEAMVAGTPAVGTACGAIPEIAGDGAILVEPHEEAFADALVRAIAGGPEIANLTAAGRERASSFSWERCAAETIAVYKSVLP
jgi:glycosyltransferase involved in cell wall biosynthesis